MPLLFQQHFPIRHIANNRAELTSALYLQVSVISQALIFVTRSRSWSFVERPCFLLMFAFLAAQLVSNSYNLFWHWYARVTLLSLLILVLFCVRLPLSLQYTPNGALLMFLALDGDGRE